MCTSSEWPNPEHQEVFLKKAVLVWHPFKEFSGLLPEVKPVCEKLANWSYEDVVN